MRLRKVKQFAQSHGRVVAELGDKPWQCDDSTSVFLNRCGLKA